MIWITIARPMEGESVSIKSRAVLTKYLGCIATPLPMKVEFAHCWGCIYGTGLYIYLLGGIVLSISYLFH